jgi:hypothetical protein
MGQRTKIDWQVVRDEFVMAKEGSDSANKAALAKKYGVRRETLTRRSIKENWDTQHAQYEHQVAMKTRAKTSMHEAQRRTLQLQSAEVLRQLASEAFTLLRKKGTKIEKGKTGEEIIVETPAPIESQLTAAEARRFMQTAAEIENHALSLEGEIMMQLSVELKEILRRLSTVLSPEDYLRTLDVLSVPDETEN